MRAKAVTFRPIWKLSAWQWNVVHHHSSLFATTVVHDYCACAQRSTFSIQCPPPALSFSYFLLFLLPRLVYLSPNDRRNGNATTDWRPNSNSSPHTEAVKNPWMTKAALSTADVKNNYKSTCSICWQTDAPTNHIRDALAGQLTKLLFQFTFS